jgi:hypothetical protein
MVTQCVGEGASLLSLVLEEVSDPMELIREDRPVCTFIAQTEGFAVCVTVEISQYGIEHQPPLTLLAKLR